jgi:hypothetical protein
MTSTNFRPAEQSIIQAAVIQVTKMRQWMQNGQKSLSNKQLLSLSRICRLFCHKVSEQTSCFSSSVLNVTIFNSFQVRIFRNELNTS